MRFMVFTDIPGPDAEAIERVATQAVDDQTQVLVSLDADGDAELTLVLDADTFQDASRKAAEQIVKLRRRAGLDLDHSAELTVAEWFGIRERARELLHEARDCLAAGHFALATIAAHCACELQVQRYLIGGAVDDGSAFADVAVRALRGRWSLTGTEAKRVFTAVAGHPVHQLAFWEDYAAHVTRRNHATHRGARLSEEEARASIDVVEQMIAFLVGPTDATRVRQP